MSVSQSILCVVRKYRFLVTILKLYIPRYYLHEMKSGIFFSTDDNWQNQYVLGYTYWEKGNNSRHKNQKKKKNPDFLMNNN